MITKTEHAKLYEFRINAIRTQFAHLRCAIRESEDFHPTNIQLAIRDLDAAEQILLWPDTPGETPPVDT